MGYLVKAKTTKYHADFDGWEFNLDINKTISQNAMDAATIATDEFVKGMDIRLETDPDEFGSIVVSTEAQDYAFFYFCLSDIVRGAVRAVRGNCPVRFQSERKGQTIDNLKKLRASMLELVSIVDEAIEDPFDES